MRYTTEEALAEIMRRRDQITFRRNRRACRILSGVVGALLAALIMVIGLLPGGGSALTGSVYGSFLLSAEAGGYVLVSVIAFALGVCVTLLCLRYRNSKDGADNENQDATLTK